MIINILHTNDIHSRFEKFSKIVTKVNKLKDESTLLLDAGDFNDFMRIELQGTSGMAGVELLESAGYDAIAVGNNEAFQGVEVLEHMAQNSKVPFLSCNLKKQDLSEIKGVKHSVIIEKQGLRFLIIGASPKLNEFYPLFNLKLVDYKEAIIDEIYRNKGKYDVCVVLSHLGIERDKEIAKDIEDVDVIIGGHTHILMDTPTIINNTVLHICGCYGEKLGIIKLDVDKDTANNKRKKVKLIEYKNIDVEDERQDKNIMNLLKTNKEKAIDALSVPLYKIKKDLWHDVIEENLITNLLADALKDVFNTDIGLINSGILNGGIRKGNVSIKKLIDICPSPLNPTYMEIKGKYIRKVLQDSLDANFCMKDGKGAGFRGKYLGRLHVSGAVIEYNLKSILRIIINGKEIEDEKWYTVATSDYLQRGTGYKALKNNKNRRYKSGYLREILKQYLCKDDYVERAYIDRWILK